MNKYVCKKCGSGDFSYQVGVDEDLVMWNKYPDDKVYIEWAENGQAWCNGKNGCGEIFVVKA